MLLRTQATSSRTQLSRYGSHFGKPRRTARKQILIVSPDAQRYTLLKLLLEQKGYSVKIRPVLTGYSIHDVYVIDTAASGVTDGSLPIGRPILHAGPTGDLNPVQAKESLAVIEQIVAA